MLAGRGGRGGRQRGGDDAQEQSAIETLGVRLSDLNDQLAQKFNLGGNVEGGGAVITAVTPNSPAQQAGLRVGDLITRVGKTNVGSAKEATDLLSKADFAKGVVLQVTNREGSQIITLRTPAATR